MKFITVLFRKHKKHLPACLEGTKFGEFYHYGFMIFISAWVFQGIRIMNWREATLKVALTIIPTTILILFGVHFILAFLIAHTINFAINGQLFAMYTHMGVTNVTAKHFLNMTKEIAKTCSTKKSLNAAIAYGSLSRGNFKSTSDIDLRLIPAKGELNWWGCAFFALWLRTKYFFKGYPLDLYVYDPVVVIKRMRTDELPVMLFERDGYMKEWYPERVEYAEFIEIFTKSNL